MFLEFTLLCKIEACLSPFKPFTISVDDYEPLTSDHFLLESAIPTSPENLLFYLSKRIAYRDGSFSDSLPTDFGKFGKTTT